MIPTIPSMMLGLVAALLIGAVFHLFLNGGLWRLILYLVLSVVGFSIGQLVGLWRNWILFPVGTLNLGMGIAGSLIILFVGYWLSLIRIRSESGDDAV